MHWKFILHNLKYCWKCSFFSFCLLFSFISIVNGQSDSIENIGAFDIGLVREALTEQSDTTVPYESPQQQAQEKIASVIFRIVVYLVLVVVLIIIVSWVVKKAGITGSSKVGGGGSMDTLELLPLGQNRNLILVRVMDVVYLLGQTSGSMILLEKIEGQKAIDLISSSKGESSIIQFKDALNSFMGKIKKS